MINKIGRPSLGKTKKVSITLQENDWEKLNKIINQKTEGNRSRFLRLLIIKFLENH